MVHGGVKVRVFHVHERTFGRIVLCPPYKRHDVLKDDEPQWFVMVGRVEYRGGKAVIAKGGVKANQYHFQCGF
jgi:hypothetical protein